MTQTHPTLQTFHASLAGQLTEDQEHAAKEHLAHCETCRRRFEEIAGGGRRWAQIAAALQREAQSQRSLSQVASAPGRDGDAPLYPADYAQSPVDFAIGFLEPSNRSDSIGKLAEFEILSVIGFGGMGIVLKGFQEELNRPVAVKVMAPHLATSAAARQRFLREAQATAAIVHPNVMPILSVSEKASLPFLVMPYVACHSLQQRLDAEGTLPILDVLRISLQVAEALAAAHAQGLVHRDVKPANILLERGVDRALLTDFGLARAVDDATLTRSGVIAGTPQYMSPEQARGDAIDARSDLFSLGSAIYAMCVGHPPFRAETSYGILRKVTDSEPRPMREQNVNVPSWLERLTAKLMAKEPSQRYASASEVANLLRQCLAQVQQPMVQSIPPCLQDDAPKTSRRVLVAMIAAFATVCVAVAWLWLFAIGSADGPQPAFVLHDDVPQEPAESLSLLPMPTVDIAADLRQLSHEADVLLQQMDADYPVVNSRTDSSQGAP